MRVDTEKDVELMRKIAESLYLTLVCSDYGVDAAEHLTMITSVAIRLYQHIALDQTFDIVIYKPIDEGLSLMQLHPTARTVDDYTWFASNNSRVLIIEPINEYRVNVVCDVDLDIDSMRQNAVIYTFYRGKETIWGKSTENTLENDGDLVSYFSLTTYKTLEEALSTYEVRKAKYSNCRILSDAWLDETRIFLKSGSPEKYCKQSLLEYLQNFLRADVKEEQNVSPTKPIDIKVTFEVAKHIALIEVKWLGKSVHEDRSAFSQEMFESVAKAGAKQLSNYLDSHRTISTQLATKGYLVVFDARRRGTKLETRTINRVNGFYYENRNINYEPRFHTIRNDFAEPRRFFIAPMVTP